MTRKAEIRNPAFTGLTNSNSSEGESPLALSGDTLYGTTGGGRWGFGTVYAANADGTSFATLYNFTGVLNHDESGPRGRLVIKGNILYGTTVVGSSLGQVAGGQCLVFQCHLV